MSCKVWNFVLQSPFPLTIFITRLQNWKKTFTIKFIFHNYKYPTYVQCEPLLPLFHVLSHICFMVSLPNHSFYSNCPFLLNSALHLCDLSLSHIYCMLCPPNLLFYSNCPFLPNSTMRLHGTWYFSVSFLTIEVSFLFCIILWVLILFIFFMFLALLVCILIFGAIQLCIYLFFLAPVSFCAIILFDPVIFRFDPPCWYK